MRVVALELNNDIKGIEQRKQYIESLIAKLPNPEFVVLPELALCSYMASNKIWQYADDCGKDTYAWSIKIARKYNIYIGVGYLDKENGDYFNRYLIAGGEQVYGVVTKSEGESAVFKRGKFGSIIHTPFGDVGVAICYDAKRKHFYKNIENVELSLIIFPHGCPANPKKPDEEIRNNDYLCETYAEAFGIPVIYVNSIGKLEYMPGKMGELMKKAGFLMNGRSKIYRPYSNQITCKENEVIGADLEIRAMKRKKDIRFYGNDLIKGNWLFRLFVLNPDTKKGIKLYKSRR